MALAFALVTWPLLKNVPLVILMTPMALPTEPLALALIVPVEWDPLLQAMLTVPPAAITVPFGGDTVRRAQVGCDGGLPVAVVLSPDTDTVPPVIVVPGPEQPVSELVAATVCGVGVLVMPGCKVALPDPPVQVSKVLVAKEGTIAVLTRLIVPSAPATARTAKRRNTNIPLGSVLDVANSARSPGQPTPKTGRRHLRSSASVDRPRWWHGTALTSPAAEACSTCRRPPRAAQRRSVLSRARRDLLVGPRLATALRDGSGASAEATPHPGPTLTFTSKQAANYLGVTDEHSTATHTTRRAGGDARRTGWRITQAAIDAFPEERRLPSRCRETLRSTY